MKVSRLLRAVAAGGLLVAGGACGSGGSRPSVFGPTPSATVLRIVSGLDDSPVSGASVVLDGVERGAANGAGTLQLDTAVAAGQTVRITAGGHLDRETLVRSTASLRFSLWPETTIEGLTPPFTSDIVYAFYGALTRIGDPDTVVRISPSAQITTDAEALATHRAAAAAMTAATGGAIEFVVVETGAAGGFVVSTVINPSDPSARTGAGAKPSRLGNRITSGSIVFKTIRQARSLGIVLHELGHIYGLGHSSDTTDLMGPGPDGQSDFTAREKQVMRMMRLRPPGNLPPDRDDHIPVAAAGGGGLEEQTIACVVD